MGENNFKECLFKNRKNECSGEKIVYDAWEKKWKENQKENQDCDNEDLFCKLFKKTYKEVCEKSRKNEKKNFCWKWLFLFTASIYPIIKLIQVIDVTYKILKTDNVFDLERFIDMGYNFEGMISSIGTFSIFLIFALVIAKWLDIKKYQETWIRHAMHKQKLDKEMFLYISKLGIYSEPDKEYNFVMRILEIWDGNHSKFGNNMKDEKVLTDMLDKLKN